ncbi:MAG: GerMN domain-containing protein [bacterium]|nr:GerMN domain-containing protein [bacterium]MDT8396085.1 GerMN domain-containing protein [bacterium]
MRKGFIVAALLVVVIGGLYAYLRLSVQGGGGAGEISLSGSEEPSSDTSMTREVDLYFADSSGRRLALERREVAGTGRQGLLRAVIEELVKGPVGEDRVRTLPETTQVKAVYFQDATVWVDLGASIVDEHPGGAWTEVLTVYSIVNTITENFTEVDQVQIIVDGRERETLAGHVDISGPLPGRVQLLSGEWE